MTKHEKIPKICPECDADIKLIRQKPPRATFKKKVLFLVLIALCGLGLVISMFVSDGPKSMAAEVARYITMSIAIAFATLILALPSARDIKCPKCDWETTILVNKGRLRSLFK